MPVNHETAGIASEENDGPTVATAIVRARKSHWLMRAAVRGPFVPSGDRLQGLLVPVAERQIVHPR